MNKTPTEEAVERATRPIVGMHNRTAQEVFDIMCDRVRFALHAESLRAARLQAERDRAVEALRPFAATGAVLDAKPKDNAVWAGQRPAAPLTFGDFRRAAAVVSTLPPPVKEAEREQVGWDMHGGYGRCTGTGAVWVDDGEQSNFYRHGSCPACLPPKPTTPPATPPALQARVEALEAVVKEAAAKFRSYAQLHSIKGTPDGDAKAITNMAMAEKLEAALTGEKG